ncbi:hypothetical protein MLD38_036189 [Melastoma candidum]|uniref:Uncharacterized protein n=1 Tax=Melastoma candidum TaxID=119954 RepID=A0ACB9LKT7_9MYRT|nr:hypothetical protein MLD38_036189 [Melastoma candidum]
MAVNGLHVQRRGGCGGSSKASFFGLPKLFTSFTTVKATSENDSVISPKSILDGKPFFTLRNSFLSDPNSISPVTPDSKRVVIALGSSSTGLGIANVLQDEVSSAKLEPRPALFGSKLKIQITPLTNNSSEKPSPRSPSDFGIKTKNSNPVGNNSEIPSPIPDCATPGVVPFSRCLSPREMEMSEDYTCIISHGPNPKTTHIYYDCILESCCDSITEFSAPSSPETRIFQDNGHRTKNFLSFCDGCNKSLEENDIYMYRGEKAFCSCECRLREILMEERLEKLKS